VPAGRACVARPGVGRIAGLRYRVERRDDLPRPVAAVGRLEADVDVEILVGLAEEAPPRETREVETCVAGGILEVRRPGFRVRDRVELPRVRGGRLPDKDIILVFAKGGVDVSRSAVARPVAVEVDEVTARRQVGDASGRAGGVEGV